MTFTPLGIASLCATGIIAPMTVWAIQNTFKTLKRANSIAQKFTEYKRDTESKLCDLRKAYETAQLGTAKDLEQLRTDTRRDIEGLKTGAGQVDARIQRVEDAIVSIRESAQQNQEHFSTIMAELKLLTKLNATIEAFSRDIQSIVPRTEVDARLKNFEDRLHIFELGLHRDGGAR